MGRIKFADLNDGQRVLVHQAYLRKTIAIRRMVYSAQEVDAWQLAEDGILERVGDHGAIRYYQMSARAFVAYTNQQRQELAS